MQTEHCMEPNVVKALHAINDEAMQYFAFITIKALHGIRAGLSSLHAAQCFKINVAHGNQCNLSIAWQSVKLKQCSTL
eukprot:scaffold117428_cov23-Tisochrysis_lutea.AAC.3